MRKHRRATVFASVPLIAAVVSAIGLVQILSSAAPVHASVAAAERSCVVPNVKGRSLGAARTTLRRSGCAVGTIRRAFSATVPRRHVISQRPHAGAHRRSGAKVRLVVSKGKRPAPLPSVGRVVASISISNSPMGLLSLPGALWVTAHDGDSLSRVDTSSNKVVAKVTVGSAGGQPGRMALGDGTIFVENYSSDGISLVDPATNTVKSVIHGPFENCCQPTYGAGSLWLLEVSPGSDEADRLVRLDSYGHVQTTLNVPVAGGLAFGAGSVWGSSNGKVFRLDPATNKITARIAADAPFPSYGAGSVWGLSTSGKELVRIDPQTNAVSASIRLPAPGGMLAATDSAVWVTESASQGQGSHLWKIDPATNKVIGQVKLGKTDLLGDLSVGSDGSVWVSLFYWDLVLRVGSS